MHVPTLTEFELDRNSQGAWIEVHFELDGEHIATDIRLDSDGDVCFTETYLHNCSGDYEEDDHIDSDAVESFIDNLLIRGGEALMADRYDTAEKWWRGLGLDGRTAYANSRLNINTSDAVHTVLGNVRNYSLIVDHVVNHVIPSMMDAGDYF